MLSHSIWIKNLVLPRISETFYPLWVSDFWFCKIILTKCAWRTVLRNKQDDIMTCTTTRHTLGAHPHLFLYFTFLLLCIPSCSPQAAFRKSKFTDLLGRPQPTSRCKETGIHGTHTNTMILKISGQEANKCKPK